jgi:hypothetical protein
MSGVLKDLDLLNLFVLDEVLEELEIEAPDEHYKEEQENRD